jgi:CysZ protein
MNLELNKKAGNNPLLALQSLIKGIALVRHKKLRQYVLMPILINFCLYSVMLYLGYQYIGVLIAQFIPDWLQWLDWLIYPLFFVSFFVAVFFSFTLVANLIAAPFYGGLAAKALHLLRDEEGAVQEQALLAVIGSEVRRIGYLLSRAIPIAIISVIPGVNLIAPVLWGLFGAWGLSMEYFAYTLENEGFLFAEQRQALKSVRIGALSFGGIVLFALMVPVLNIVIPPIAVVSAVIYRQKLTVK